jgi:hypothetical protein
MSKLEFARPEDIIDGIPDGASIMLPQCRTEPATLYTDPAH